MAIFNSYVKLPEGRYVDHTPFRKDGFSVFKLWCRANPPPLILCYLWVPIAAKGIQHIRDL